MTFDKIDGACSLYNKTAYAQDDSLFLIEGDEHEEVDTSLYAEIDAEVTRLQAEYDAQQYARDRQYPALGDCIPSRDGSRDSSC